MEKGLGIRVKPLRGEGNRDGRHEATGQGNFGNCRERKQEPAARKTEAKCEDRRVG